MRLRILFRGSGEGWGGEGGRGDVNATRGGFRLQRKKRGYMWKMERTGKLRNFSGCVAACSERSAAGYKDHFENAFHHQCGRSERRRWGMLNSRVRYLWWRGTLAAAAGGSMVMAGCIELLLIPPAHSLGREKDTTPFAQQDYASRLRNQAWHQSRWRPNPGKGLCIGG